MHPLIQEFQKGQLKKVPEMAPGYTVQVHQKIKEAGKERIQIFAGLVIGVGKGAGIEKTVTVRKIVEGVGVEKTFPIHSPNVVKWVVKKKAEVRRAKLYYMRGLSGKATRLKETHMGEAAKEPQDPAKMEELIQEAVEAAKKEEVKQASAEIPVPAAPETEKA